MDARDDEGSTALMWAASVGHLNVVEVGLWVQGLMRLNGGYLILYFFPCVIVFW